MGKITLGRWLAFATLVFLAIIMTAKVQAELAVATFISLFFMGAFIEDEVACLTGALRIFLTCVVCHVISLMGVVVSSCGNLPVIGLAILWCISLALATDEFVRELPLRYRTPFFVKSPNHVRG